MDSAPKPELAAALEVLWQRFLPQTLERIAVLEGAAVACASGKIKEAQIRSAHEAAHKLAGSLGSFNLTRGSILARELELLYSVEDAPDITLSAKLSALATELRKMVESR